MTRSIDEIVSRVERDFPPEHRSTWTAHTTSEAKAEDDFLYLVGVIGKLYEKIDVHGGGSR